jgi:hypothetical protein
MLNCHCRDCQRAGGSGYSPTVIVRRTAFALLQGEPAQYTVTGESGATARREFCAACGSPLFASSSARADMIGIRAPSLDDPGEFAPQAEVWTASAQPWDRPNPELPTFARNRVRA